jgi:hypothetical protein
MNRRSSLFLSVGVSLLLISGAILFSPHLAQALTGPQTDFGPPATTQAPTSNQGSIWGLVTCTGPDCQACNVVQLIQALINFALGLSIPLAIALVAYSGALRITSVANPAGIKKSSDILWYAIVGFIIALAGYMVIDTLLHTVLDQNYFESKSWNSIECVDPKHRPIDKNINDVIKQVTGTLGAPPACNNGYTYYAEIGGCMNNAGDIQGPVSGGTAGQNYIGPSAEDLKGGVDSSGHFATNFNDACQKNSISDCKTLQAICAVESGCGANVGSHNGCNDVGACGMMQILPATACSTNHNFSSGCNADGTINNISQVQLDLQGAKSIDLAAQIYNRSVSYCGTDTACIVASYNGGRGATDKSIDCPGLAKWQCPYDSLSATTGKTCYNTGNNDCKPNKGYVETRRYVDSINTALGLLTK